MNLLKLFEADALWVMPTRRQLKEEYEYEYINPRRNWPRWTQQIGAQYPLFDSEPDFAEKVFGSKIVPYKNEMIHNISEPVDLDELKAEVAHHSKKKDVDKLVLAFQSRQPMATPIVITGRRGKWLMAGNTRWNIARLLEIPIRYVEVDAR